MLDRLELLPEPQRHAIATAFGVADGEAPDLFLVGLATLGLIAERAAESPLLVVVEDAHELDRSSAEVLEFVARRVESDPAVLLFAVRDGVASSFDDADLPELRLTGLDMDASNALLDRVAAALPAALRRRILDEAAGNPLALIELPAASAELGTRAPSGSLPLNARLEQAFTSRLAHLATEVRRLLLLAALDDVDLVDLGRAAGVPLTPDDLTEAVAAGLGTIDSARFRFRHPLIPSAVERAATPEELRDAHGALAEALAAEPDRAVWHRAAATSGPSEEVALMLDAAAERARLRGGGDVALAAYERAAELTADLPARARRLFLAGELALGLGSLTEGVSLLRAAQHFGLPSPEHAIASFDLEYAESRWSGPAMIRDFERMARELADSGEGQRALEALAAVAVRAFFERVDDETRREITAISDEIQAPADDPARLKVPVCRTWMNCSRWAQPRSLLGPTRSPCRSSRLRRRELAQRGVSICSCIRSCSSRGPSFTAEPYAGRSPVRRRARGSPRRCVRFGT